MSPKEMLTKELASFKKSARKSLEAFEAGKISKELHRSHLVNLAPKIIEFEEALHKLNS